jgi:hypothetical protein
MTDPFDIVRERLVAAAEASAGAAQTGGQRRGRLLVALVAAVLVSASAAAAIVSLTGEDSAPLTGKPGGGPSGAPHYVIELLPYLSAGETGWCTTLVLRHGNGQPISGGEGCGPAPPAGAPQIVGGGMSASSPSEDSVSYAVVDGRVVSVRVDGGRRIIPRASAGIPPGWKAAVWFTAGGSEPPGSAPTMPAFLNQDGRLISTAPNERAGTRAAGTAKLATRPVDPAHPPRQLCAIRVPSSPRLRVISERVVTATPVHAPDVNGRAFRTCASAVIYLGDRRFTAAVLVDARNPTHQAAQLPGQHQHRTAAGIVEAGGKITARRARPGWLVVRGISPAQRVHLLRAINTGR